VKKLTDFMRYFEWVESKPAGTEIGSYDSEGNPTSRHLRSSSGGYCALGQFDVENSYEIFFNPCENPQAGHAVAHAYNQGTARTREDYLNVLSKYLPEDHKIDIPTPPVPEVSEESTVCPV